MSADGQDGLSQIGTPVTVRVATADDVEGIRALLIETWHAAYDAILGFDEVENKCRYLFSPDAIRYHIVPMRMSRFYVAHAGGRLAGISQCEISLFGHVTIYMLYIRPEHQRHGRGLELLTYSAGSFPWARSLRLEVLEPNLGAISFYERHGFEKSDRYFDFRRASVPISLMRRDLWGHVSKWHAAHEYLRAMIA